MYQIASAKSIICKITFKKKCESFKICNRQKTNKNVNGKIKCRKSVKLNVGFPTFLFDGTITIEVIVKMNEKEEVELKNVLKEMIRLNVKPNFAALGREYGCDYRTAKVKYYEEQNKEKWIEMCIDTLELSGRKA